MLEISTPGAHRFAVRISDECRSVLLDEFECSEAVARVTEAGETMERTTPLGLSYPAEIYSLSRVALPFPMSDSLYGLYPDSSEDFGINLGAMASRGERGALIVSLDSLLRVSSNPFFAYLVQRIEEGIAARPQ